MSEAELRAIDAQIAERVMGWKRYPRAVDIPRDHFAIGANAKSTDWVWITDSEPPYPSVRFSPTTFADDAMAVLKRVLETSPSFAVERVAPEHTVSGNIAYQCGAFEDGIYKDRFFVLAPTLELTICQFALKLFP